MKTLRLLLLFVPLISFGQEYYVSAKGGVNVREAPDAKAKKIETLLYGQKVTVESETGIKLTINDFDQRSGDTKIIEGEWVKIEYAKTFYTIPRDGDIYSDPYEIKKYEGYIFNGFLKEAFFPQYIDENYIDFNSMDNIYIPTGTVVYFNEEDKAYESNPSIIEYFKDVEKPKSLTSCYKYKSGILFSGIAYDIILSDPFYVIDPFINSSKKYESGPKIDIYIAEFKNGVLTGKQKRINPLEGIETEKIKIIGLDQIGVEKEIVVKYSDLTIEFGDLQEYVYVNDVAFFDLDGNRISDFPPFNFWVNNRESFLFDMNNKNKFLKIKYFPEYIEPRGQYGIQDKIHFFDSDCNLYDIVKEVEVIEDFNVKVKSNKIANTVADHYICFNGDDNSMVIWVSYSREEKALEVKYKGQDKAMQLVHTKGDSRFPGAYIVSDDYYIEMVDGKENGQYKITHSGIWDYVEYKRGTDGKIFKFTIDHNANPYGDAPCF